MVKKKSSFEKFLRYIFSKLLKPDVQFPSVFSLLPVLRSGKVEFPVVLHAKNSNNYHKYFLIPWFKYKFWIEDTFKSKQLLIFLATYCRKQKFYFFFNNLLLHGQLLQQIADNSKEKKDS